MALIAASSIGRVGVSIGALPAILPVNYALLDGRIVFRTSPGTKLTAALQEAIVAFEVDHGADDASAGWSVLVVGRARRIPAGDFLDRARGLRLDPWTPGGRDEFVQIIPDVVTGRRIESSPFA